LALATLSSRKTGGRGVVFSGKGGTNKETRERKKTYQLFSALCMFTAREKDLRKKLEKNKRRKGEAKRV